MVAHVLIDGPRHHLKVGAELRMRRIRVDAGSDQLDELFPCKSSGQARLFRRQVARNNGTEEDSSSTEVASNIDSLLLAHERVTALFIIRLSMTVVAASDRVDDVTAKANQRWVLAAKIQMHGRDLETLPDSRIIVISVMTVVMTVVVSVVMFVVACHSTRRA